MVRISEGEEPPEVRLDGACVFAAADSSIQAGELESRSHPIGPGVVVDDRLKLPLRGSLQSVDSAARVSPFLEGRCERLRAQEEAGRLSIPLRREAGALSARRSQTRGFRARARSHPEREIEGYRPVPELLSRSGEPPTSGRRGPAGSRSPPTNRVKDPEVAISGESQLVLERAPVASEERNLRKGVVANDWIVNLLGRPRGCFDATERQVAQNVFHGEHSLGPRPSESSFAATRSSSEAAASTSPLSQNCVKGRSIQLAAQRSRSITSGVNSPLARRR